MVVGLDIERFRLQVSGFSTKCFSAVGLAGIIFIRVGTEVAPLEIAMDFYTKTQVSSLM